MHLSHHECTLCWTYCGLVFGAPLTPRAHPLLDYCGLVFGAPLTPRMHPLLDLLWTCIWCTLCWTYCGLVLGAPLTPRVHPLLDLLWTCIWCTSHTTNAPFAGLTVDLYLVHLFHHECTLCWTYCGFVFGAPLTPRVHPLLDLLWTCIWCTPHTTSAPFARLTVDLYLVHLSHHECTLCWTYCGLVFGAPLTPRVHPLLDLLWTCIWCTPHTTSAPFARLTVDLYLVHLSHHECTLCCLQMLSPTTEEKDTFCSTMLFLHPSIVP